MAIEREKKKALGLVDPFWSFWQWTWVSPQTLVDVVKADWKFWIFSKVEQIESLCFVIHYTERFTDLGKLNLLMVVQFTIMLQLPIKTMLNLKVVKIDSIIIISLLLSKSLTHSVVYLLTNHCFEEKCLCWTRFWRWLAKICQTRRRVNPIRQQQFSFRVHFSNFKNGMKTKILWF